VGKCHTEFTLFEDRNFYPFSFACKELRVSHEIGTSYDLCHTSPPMLDCVDTKAPDLAYAKVDFVAPERPSITKDEPYAINKGSTSDYCMFARVLMCLPPMAGIEYDFDLRVEFGSGPSDGTYYKIILYAGRPV